MDWVRATPLTDDPEDVKAARLAERVTNHIFDQKYKGRAIFANPTDFWLDPRIDPTTGEMRFRL